MVSVAWLVEGWNWFFHEPESPATVGAFRAVWGGLLLLNGMLFVPYARRFLGVDGLVSLRWIETAYGRSRFSLFQLLPTTNGSVYLVLGLHLLAAVSLAVGFYTRFSALVAFVTLVSLHHRNTAVRYGADSVMRLLTFLLIFSRAGEAYSLDGWLGGDGQTSLVGVPGSPWCERLMQLQIAFVYLHTVFWKLRGRLWRSGEAAYYPLYLECFSRLRLPKLGRHMLLIRLLTWSTLVVELSLGTLVWVHELRYLTLAAGVLLHLGLDLVLNVQLFGLTMIVCFILFVPPQDMTWLLAAVLGAP